MKKIILSTIITLALFSGLIISSVYAEKPSARGDEVVMANDDDPVMAEAIKKARATLDDFLKRYESKKPNVDDYKLKVMITDKHGTEHFWVQPFKQKKDGSFEGTLANSPQIVRSVTAGQKVTFKRDKISDWGYVEDGKQFGSYTVCALFKSMPKEQVEYYRKNHGFQCK